MILVAAGENMLGRQAFAQSIASGAFGVVQPDIAKWGGISGAWQVIQNIRAQGLRYCPQIRGLAARIFVLLVHTRFW